MLQIYFSGMMKYIMGNGYLFCTRKNQSAFLSLENYLFLDLCLYRSNWLTANETKFLITRVSQIFQTLFISMSQKSERKKFKPFKSNIPLYRNQSTDVYCKSTIQYLSLREKCQYLEFFWSVFSRIRTEYGEILRISPYSV